MHDQWPPTDYAFVGNTWLLVRISLLIGAREKKKPMHAFFAENKTVESQYRSNIEFKKPLLFY